MSDLLPPTEALDQLELADYAQNAYLSYALSVVKGRALPDLRDGLKPVQRRILYAMHRLRLGSQAKPVKSAKVVGDVLSKFHPHGDGATYEALVRMAQDFSLRYPVVDGQGNFGSRDGDAAAAMRYTETRLQSIAESLIAEVDAGTVNHITNYDGSEHEPEILPARLPFILLNGATGIAVGLSCDLPAHNLREVSAAVIAYLRKPTLSLDEVLHHIPGPDFATGGQIISSPQDIRLAYATGNGRLRVRAQWKIEDLARGQWQLIVHELPPNTSVQKVCQEIEAISNPKPKPGKKTPSADQLQTKQTLLTVLDEVRDESSRHDPIRLVFTPKTSRIDRDLLARTLLSHTSMEATTSINLVAIGLDGKPRQKNLLEIVSEWSQFRCETVKRRSQTRLGKVQDRIHILQGRQMVLLDLDTVIAVIRESDDPKAALMAKFPLSEKQTEDILELRLRQLARLEGIKIEAEIKELNKEESQLQTWIGDDKALRKQVIKEIEQDTKRWGDDRRTLIEAEKQTQLEVITVDEPVTVIVSKLGWVRCRQGHGLELENLNFKPGDTAYGVYECRSVDTLLAFDNTGRVYTVAVSQLPSGRGDGQPITTLIDLTDSARIVHFFAGAAQTSLLLAASNGLGLVAKVDDMLSRVRGGKAFFHLAPDAKLLQPQPVDGRQVAVASQKGRLLVYPSSELKVLNKGGRGIILMGVVDGDPIIATVCFDDNFDIHGIGRGQAVRSDRLNPRQIESVTGKRANKGKSVRSIGIAYNLTTLTKSLR